MPTIISLFKEAGIEAQSEKEPNTKQLIDKQLTIEMGERAYNDR
ncbi:hypothetical protein [Fibrella forsythiae]|nr:hypothetical protein [Fibrella forsythiae]